MDRESDLELPTQEKEYWGWKSNIQKTNYIGSGLQSHSDRFDSFGGYRYGAIHGGAPETAKQVLVRKELPKGGQFGNMTSRRFESFGGHRYVPGHVLRDNAHHSLGMKYEEEKVQRGWEPKGGSFTKSMSLRFDGPGSYSYGSRRLLDANDLRKQRSKDKAYRTQETSRARRSRSRSAEKKKGSPPPSSSSSTRGRGRSNERNKQERTRGRSPTYRHFFPEPRSPAKMLWSRRGRREEDDDNYSSLSSSSTMSSTQQQRYKTNTKKKITHKTPGTEAAAARLRERNLRQRMQNSFRFARKRWKRPVRTPGVESTPSVMDIASAGLEEFKRPTPSPPPRSVKRSVDRGMKHKKKKQGSFVPVVEGDTGNSMEKLLFRGLRSEKVAKLIGEKMNYNTKPGVAMFIPVDGQKGTPIRVIDHSHEVVDEIEEEEEEEEEEENAPPPPIPEKEITNEEFTSSLLSRNRRASFGWNTLMDRINQKMGGL